jgi:aspartate 1-decarboxylase
MILTMMKAKIHRATVTQTDLHYEGSITVDIDLLERSGILPFEQVDVLNINNGARFTTYAIVGKRGSGIIGINGAAARLAQRGDQVIICSYCQMEKAEAVEHKPTVVLMDADNKPKDESFDAALAKKLLTEA